MSSRVAYYFPVLALAFNTILLVKAQPTVQDCQNGDSSNIVAELNVEAIRQLNVQVQSMRELLTESFQQMKSQHSSATRRLDVVTQLLLYHDIAIKNQTENSPKLEIGVPLPLEFGIDLEDGFVLVPSVNNWIVLMQRFDGSLNFNRNWTEYRNGFGDIVRGEFWLGNEIVHRLTNRIRTVYSLRIEVELKTSGRRFHAEYTTFSLDSEDNKYALRLSGYSGNAGDSLTNTSGWTYYYHGGKSFSTPDADNDIWTGGNCAQNFQAGWWFNNCWASCLTCQYRDSFAWNSLTHLESGGSLRAARMMINSK